MSPKVVGNSGSSEGASTRSLDACIYDFLQKSSLNNTANAFVRETGLDVSHPPGFSSDVPQGFLYEWWQIFWDLFNTKVHHEGSGIAKQYCQILAEQQKREYAYRSVALQAARLQFIAEQGGEMKVDPIDQGAFSMNANYQIPIGALNPNSVGGQFMLPANFANSSGWPVYANQPFPVMPTNDMSAAITPTTSVKQKVSGGHKQYGMKRRASTSTNNVGLGNVGDFKSPKVMNSTQSTPYDSHRGGIAMNKTSTELMYNYQKQYSFLENENNMKKSSPSPMSNGISVTNNNNNMNANHMNDVTSSNTSTNKKNMHPPYSGASPHSVPASTPNAQGNIGNVNQSKSKQVRRKSSSNLNMAAGKAFGETVYSNCSPITPMTVNSTNDYGACVTSKIAGTAPSLLSTLAEVQSANSSSNSPEMGSLIGATANKKVKKVRNSKKSKNSPTNNQNGNFKFISSNSVPTPPNESSQKSQYRILKKNQSRKSASSTTTTKAATPKYSKVLSKSSAEESPQLLDDNSSTTPTFINSMWSMNGKSQTTPHTNFNYIEDNCISMTVSNTLINNETAIGSTSSSAVSNHPSENENDDLLTMKSILSMQDSSEPKTDNILNEKSNIQTDSQHNESGNHTEFNLDLLEPSESSFHYLSWQN